MHKQGTLDAFVTISPASQNASPQQHLAQPKKKRKAKRPLKRLYLSDEEDVQNGDD